MIEEVLAIFAGFAVGFFTTWKFVKVRLAEKRAERIKEVKERLPKITAEEVKIEPEKIPSNPDELVNFISKKYMLKEVTLATTDGLPIASNSETAENDVALAPEIVKFANALLNSDRVVVSSGEDRILAMKVNPEVILYAKTFREVSKLEMDKIQAEVNSMLEGLI